jgi:cytochrome c oxidase assembly protein subunit 15
VHYPHTKHHIANKQSVILLSTFCLLTLITQIAIGGWVSANYTALVCADFPTCQGQWWPTMDWQNAFRWPGVPLENNARVAIQMTHRIGAAITTILLSSLSYILWRTRVKIYAVLGVILISLLCLQICLGITNVLAGLPIIISLGHNATAVALLLCLITILFIANAKSNCT